jgi:ubiquitin-protein ligase
MDRATKRIVKEIQDLEKSRDLFRENGIYYYYNESDIKKLYVMIVGPKDSPYENGYYFFEFTYPDNYPMNPPVAKYMTQGIIEDEKKNRFNVRFNPNLYTCGKVCLSMLNTWQGPGWVPTNTISNVLVAIQALVLNENPLENEPGYENLKGDEAKKYKTYNQIIEYANWKISICNMIESPPTEFENFKMDMIDHFKKNYEKIKSKVEERKKEYNESQIIVSNSTYRMSCYIHFDQIIEKLDEIYKKY